MIHFQNLKRLAEDQHTVLRAVMLVVVTWDQDLFAHSERVANELICFAPADSVAEWYWAGLLHDLGKIALAPEILRKRGALTVRERKVMQKHSGQGADLLTLIGAPPMVIQGAQFHHERWDGTGYPSGMRGAQIPLVARVLAIADVYTALTSDRPYRRACTPEQARLEIERNAGIQFDPQIVTQFLERQNHVSG